MHELIVRDSTARPATEDRRLLLDSSACRRGCWRRIAAPARARRTTQRHRSGALAGDRASGTPPGGASSSSSRSRSCRSGRHRDVRIGASVMGPALCAYCVRTNSPGSPVSRVRPTAPRAGRRCRGAGFLDHVAVGGAIQVQHERAAGPAQRVTERRAPWASTA
jgi:hypothetical protein